ncbi:hypothetical protein [Rickettsiella endosymbiont of Dermanyssus gallinae]|uniref:hypothetical protein n=1 Tax=Rickettsiella endosymbiont of Dermanyssus gallinae TaxID=2856608 RepID=UPI001C52CD64|nr:hypothetical protein [Rickettsiella endosymbiont of Dermanyssus gallinae]
MSKFRNKYTPPSFCSVPVLLVPFDSRREAEEWLKTKGLNTSGTPLLIPFKNKKLNSIECLKPSGDRLRIMGAANEFEDKKYSGKILNWFLTPFSRDFIPHIADLVGNTIKIEENRPIIIYEKGSKSVGQKFAALFRSQIKKLENQIEAAQTNDAPRLEPAEVMQDLSKLALGLEIKAGMSYFIVRENGIAKVYRHTFHRDGDNENLNLYLEKEAEAGLSAPVRVYNNKNENNHFYAVLKDWVTGTIFAFITAIGTGFVGSIFIPAFITAPIAIITFIVLSFLAYHKALADNPKTNDFVGKSEIKVVQPNGAITRMNNTRDCQANEMPTIQRRLVPIAQKHSEAVMPTPAFFNSPIIKSVSTFLNNPTEGVANLANFAKGFEPETILKLMTRST